MYLLIIYNIVNKSFWIKKFELCICVCMCVREREREGREFVCACQRTTLRCHLLSFIETRSFSGLELCLLGWTSWPVVCLSASHLTIIYVHVSLPNILCWFLELNSSPHNRKTSTWALEPSSTAFFIIFYHCRVWM